MALVSPGLDVPAALVDPRQFQRRTADERDRFGLTLPEVPRGQITIGLQPLGGMPQQDVSELVEPRLGGEWIDRVNGDHAVPGEAEAVAVDVVKRDLLDAECLQSSSGVPVRDLRLR